MRSSNAFTLAALVAFAGCATPSTAPSTEVDDSTLTQLSLYESQFQDLLMTIDNPAVQSLLTMIRRTGVCTIPVC